MKNLCDILSKNKDLQKLVIKSKQLKQLNDLFKSSLDLNLAKHSDLAKIEKDQLTVVADNAAWATKLRFTIPDILKNLRIQPEFKMIKTIRILIATAQSAPPANLVKTKRSPKNAQLWAETIKSLKH